MGYKAQCFYLKIVPLRAVKGQALADFLAEHPCVDIQDPLEFSQRYVQLEPWVLTFNGPSTRREQELGL